MEVSNPGLDCHFLMPRNFEGRQRNRQIHQDDEFSEAAGAQVYA